MSKLARKRKISDNSQGDNNDNCSPSSNDSVKVRNVGKVSKKKSKSKKAKKKAWEEDYYDESDGSSDSTSEELSDSEDDNDNLYFVEAIRGMRVENKKKWFLVKWHGYEDSQNTWEPEDNMGGSQEIVEAYLKKIESKDQARHKGQLWLETPDKLNRSKTGVDIQKKVIDAPKGTRVTQNLTVHVRRIDVEDLQESANLPLKGKVVDSKSKDRGIPIIRKTHTRCQAASESKKASNVPTHKFVHKFRIVENNKLYFLHLNIKEEIKSEEQHYSVIVTEECQGLNPSYVYGAVQGKDGSRYCLVQFDGHEYVDVVDPSNLFKTFPGMETYYKMNRTQKKTTRKCQ